MKSVLVTFAGVCAVLILFLSLQTTVIHHQDRALAEQKALVRSQGKLLRQQESIMEAQGLLIQRYEEMFMKVDLFLGLAPMGPVTSTWRRVDE